MTCRVHVVFTGGTIGASSLDGHICLDSAPPRQILSYAPTTSPIVFSESEPFQILSEDATTRHWTDLARHIASLDLSRLDAVIVAHGSDTLAWTAPALAYALQGIPLPVVLVASDRPLDDALANGRANFRDAITFALSEKLPGIFVAWKNFGEDTAIHLATRILPCDIHDDKFRSVLGLQFGTVANDEFRRNTMEGNPSRSHLAKTSQDGSWSPSRQAALAGIAFESNVLVLAAQPGTDHRALGRKPSWKAVLQLPYHSGTACSSNDTGSLLEFAIRCREGGIPFLVGPTRHGKEPYASVERLVQSNVRFTPHTTESALVVKLRWLLGTGQDLSRLTDMIAFDLLPETNFKS